MAIEFSIRDNIGFVTFNQPDSKVNLLSSGVLQELDVLLNDIKTQHSLDCMVLQSSKDNVFIAGADIKEIEGITDPQDGEEKSQAGQIIFNKLEDLKFPSIAVIDGFALGGGCELALACDYRIATFNEKVKIGLPEVNLGILPGFGGTYRLPRLIGLTEGLKIILAGRVVSGTQALRIGLIDRLYPQAGLENSLYGFIEEVKGEKRRKSFKRRQKFPVSFLDNTILGRAIVFSQSKKNVLKVSKGFYPAPLKALSVVRRTITSSRKSALRLEAKAFGQLVISEKCKNLISVFYLSEKYKKLLPKECERIKPKVINKCGVLGAGVMGGGIAQLLSYKDIKTRMKDINYEALGLGLKSANMVYQQAVKKRKLTASQAGVKMDMISTTVDYSGFQNTDCVIEAVVENMDVKKAVFKELSAVVPSDTVLCSNTSALSVTEMARQVKNPDRVVGFHFFNPVHRMPLVEIVKTEMTSYETLATALGLARRLGKIPIIVKDRPGFLVNRILLNYVNEAGRILTEGFLVEDIDAVMTDFGMPMGPLMLSDEVGIDVGIKVLEILHGGLGERFKPVEIFKAVYKAELLGKKSGRGFYIHNKNKNPNPEINRFQGRRRQTDPKHAQEFLKRLVYVMINEAARCLEENVAEDASVIDVGMIMGTGFPPFRGGLLKYADSVGLLSIVNDLNELSQKYKTEHFLPCHYLVEKSKSSNRFYH